jgi:hypothetical protein
MDTQRLIWRRCQRLCCSAWLCLPVMSATAAADIASAAPSANTAAASAAPTEPARAIYQQRGADGRVLLTDRPAAGLPTQRRWTVEPEDPRAAAARAEASREQSERVTERVQRSIDAQQRQHNELQIEQMRSQQATDAARAEREREWQLERDWASRHFVVPYPSGPWFPRQSAHQNPHHGRGGGTYRPGYGDDSESWPHQPGLGDTAAAPAPRQQTGSEIRARDPAPARSPTPSPRPTPR